MLSARLPEDSGHDKIAWEDPLENSAGQKCDYIEIAKI